MLISCPFWQYSDLYSSPYFVSSQEPAFGPVSDLRMLYQTYPHLPTIFAFPVSLWSYSRWHHLHDNYTVWYQHHCSPEASEHPLLSSILTSGIPTSASVLPHVTSYFRPIDSHDHYILHPSRFHAMTSQCRSLLPDLVIWFPRLIWFTTSKSPELNSVPLSPSELSNPIQYHSPSSVVPPFIWLNSQCFP